MSKNDGGPAFPLGQPTEEGVEWNINDTGMSLRDYFAALAMAALIPRRGARNDVAACAYHIADAMLLAREAE